MVRERLFGHRWLVYTVVSWSVVVAVAPHVADAAPLPPTGEQGGDRALGQVRTLLEEPPAKTTSCSGSPPASLQMHKGGSQSRSF